MPFYVHHGKQSQWRHSGLPPQRAGFAYCTSPDESIDLATSGKQTASDNGLRQLFFSLAGHDEHLQETSKKIGHSPEELSKTQTCNKESHLDRSCTR